MSRPLPSKALTSQPRIVALLRELQQVLTELNLVSQLPASNIGGGSRSSDEDIGGKRPKGGIERRDDSEKYAPDHPQRSADFFLRKVGSASRHWSNVAQDDMNRAVEGFEKTLEQLITDAAAALRAWRKTPLRMDVPLERESFEWKCAIARDPRDEVTLIRVFSISRMQVRRYRELYKDI